MPSLTSPHTPPSGLFETCGPVNRVTIPLNRKTNSPQGYAYISFDTTNAPDAVDTAVALDGLLEANGRFLKVTPKRMNLPGLKTRVPYTEGNEDKETGPTLRKLSTVRVVGDWICDNCETSNFGWRVECHRCGKARPGNQRLWPAPGPVRRPIQPSQKGKSGGLDGKGKGKGKGVEPERERQGSKGGNKGKGEGRGQPRGSGAFSSDPVNNAPLLDLGWGWALQGDGGAASGGQGKAKGAPGKGGGGKGAGTKGGGAKGGPKGGGQGAGNRHRPTPYDRPKGVQVVLEYPPQNAPEQHGGSPVASASAGTMVYGGDSTNPDQPVPVQVSLMARKDPVYSAETGADSLQNPAIVPSASASSSLPPPTSFRPAGNQSKAPVAQTKTWTEKGAGADWTAPSKWGDWGGAWGEWPSSATGGGAGWDESTVVYGGS